MNRLPRLALITAGMAALATGIAGIFIPILPTTPFLLLAAAAFAKSSAKLHAWLLDHPWFGRYIRDYIEKRGIRLHIKIVAISVLWLSIGASAIFGTRLLLVRIALVLVAGAVTWHIASLKTLRGRMEEARRRRP